MAREFPALNPFPAQATTAIEEGSFLDSYRPWAKSTPTLLLDPVRRTTALVGRFQGSTKVAGRREGQAVFVHGEHGSGKTHAIRAAVGQVATEMAASSLLPLYVKLSSPTFVHAYRLLMAQLSLSELTDIALKFLGSLSRGGPLPLHNSVDFQRNPSVLLDMFNKHLLERGLLLQAQADRLQNVVQDESNFQRALIYLLEPDLKDAAFGWLQARHVPDSELRRLGISGPLDSADQCRYGLQLLTLLCDRANRPLIIILDQAEKFLVDPAGRLVPESAGFLHSLVEAVPDIGGMLIVASSEETWSLLPQDLRQRFGSNDVPCFPLQPSQAFELLGLYILTALDPASPMGYRPAWPYTDAAVEKLLRNSGGNLRGLLQLAWQSFDGVPAGAELIDADDIPDDVLVLDRETVEMSVRRALWRLGPLIVAPRYGFQYAVTLPGPSRLLIRLTEALFYLAEAERAEEDILARVKAESDQQGTDAVAERHVLIVIGYASADVRSLLERVYDEVLVYRDAESLSRALDDLVGSGRESRGARDNVNLSELYGELADLAWSRVKSTDLLEQSVKGLGQRYSSDQADQRFEELARRWAEERTAITVRIAEARRQRAAMELAELNRVERTHQSNILLLNGSAAALLIVATFLLGWLPTGLPVALKDGLLGALATAAFMVLMAAVVGGLRFARATVPVSLAEAERIARDRIYRYGVFSPLSTLVRRLRAAAAGVRTWLGRTSPNQVTPQSLPAQLHSGDPYRRYGYLLTGAQDTSRRNLRGALNTERVALIRRVLADRLGRRLLDNESWWLVISPTDDDLAELPYIVQHRRGGYWNEISGFHDQARLLVALASRDSGGIRDGGPASAFDIDRSRVLGGLHRGSEEPASSHGKRDGSAETSPAVVHVVRAHAGRGALGEAYRAVLSGETLTRASAEVEDHELRQISRLLSPFDGLGANDHLQLASEIEQLYLFFEQLLYFRDGGALGY